MGSATATDSSGGGSDAAQTESTVLPSDDAEDGDLGGLFDDMGETIDALADPDADRTTPSEGTASGQPDTSGFDSMFPEDDLDSIFDPDPSHDEPVSEPAGEQETAAAGPEEPTKPPTDDSAADGDTGGSAASSSGDESDADAPETPTIDLGDGAGAEKSPDDAEDDGADSDDPVVADRSTETRSADDGSPATETDAAADNGGNTDAAADNGTGDTDVATDDGSTGTDDEESIFGGGSDSIFADDEDVADDDSGSLFDGSETSDEESIFRDDPDDADDEPIDGNNGIFDDGTDEDDDA